MKIQSSKPESAGQISTGDATTAASAPTSSMDMIFNTLLDMPSSEIDTSTTTQVSVSTDTNEMPENEKDENTIASAETTDGQFNNLLIEPLKIMSVDELIEPNTEENLTQKTALDMSKLTLPLPVKTNGDIAGLLAQYDENSQLIVPSNSNIEPEIPVPVLAEETLQASQSASTGVVNEIGKQLTNIAKSDKNNAIMTDAVDDEVATSLATITGESKLTIALKNPPTLPTLPAQLTNQQNPLDLANAPSLQPLLSSTTSTSGDSLDASISTNANVSISGAGGAEHTQYLNAFNHLSNFINHQTAQFDFTKEFPSADLKTFSSLNFEQKLNPDIDNNLNIQLMPLMNSALKSGYDAKIQIYPPELGQVLARLKINQNSAELVISTENNHVKQIVEANLPLLKQHFQNINIDLTDVQVQANLQQDKEDDASNNQQVQEEADVDKKSPPLNKSANNSPEKTRQSSHTIDTYA